MSAYPQAYRDYLIFFQAERDYFECHEVMEEYWKEHPDDERGRTYVTLIQLAVGMYHQRRGNIAGAVKMLESVVRYWHMEQMASLGLHAEELLERVQERLAALRRGDAAFSDLQLPVSDKELLQSCIQEAGERGFLWGAPSDLQNEQLIQKHTLRDRSEVIEEREKQKSLRKTRGAN